MTSVPLRRPFSRFLVAASLLVGVSACGSSDDSGRQRNSALEDCIPADDGSLPDGCIPEDNGQGQKVDCEAQWDPSTNAVTLCTDFRKIEIRQRKANGQPVGQAETVESDAGANAVQVELKNGAESIDVAVWTANAGGNLRKAGSVSFTAAEGERKTFSYMPDASTDGTPTPDTDASGDDQSVTTDPGTPEETTTTVDESTTTTEAEQTTTTAPEEPTTTTSEPGGGESPDTSLPPLLVEREECFARWNAATTTFETCRVFDAVTVAVYGRDGRFIKRFDAENASQLTLDAETAGRMAYAYASVGTLMDGGTKEVLPVSRAREWMTFSDPGEDKMDSFLLESTTQPELRMEAETRDVQLSHSPSSDAGTDVIVVDTQYGDSFLPTTQVVLQSGSAVGVGFVAVPAAVSHPWRIYVQNEFGMLSLAGSGVFRTDQPSPTISISDFSLVPLAAIKMETDSVSIDTGVTMNPENWEGDECADSQPVLFTNPVSPAKRNKVTITLDADCSSQDGIAGVLVADSTLLMVRGLFDSIVWGSTFSTRYLNSIEETLYLPSGGYSIYYFQVLPSAFRVDGMDYEVNAAGTEPSCAAPELGISTDDRIATLTGCTGIVNLTAGAMPLSPGENDFAGTRYVDLYFDGNTLSLTGVEAGWWTVSVMGGRWQFVLADFALCISECGLQGSPGSVDTSSLAESGKMTVSNPDCATLDDRLGVEAEFSYWSTSTYMRSRPDRAYRMQSADGDDGFNQGFPASFGTRATSPGELLVVASCSRGGYDEQTNYRSLESVSVNLVDGSAVSATVPSNDNIADAADVTGASSATVNLVNATVEPGESFGSFIGWTSTADSFQTVWLKFTATADGEFEIRTPGTDVFDIAAALTVFKKDEQNRLGFVTTNLSLAKWVLAMEMLCCSEEDLVSYATGISFNVRTGSTYYVQALLPVYTPDEVTIEFSAPEPDTWVAPSTTETPEDTGTTEPAVTSTAPEPEQTTTSAPATTTSAPDTTTPSATTTEPGSPAPTDNAGGSEPSTTVPAGGAPGDAAVVEDIKRFIKDGTANESAPVLAPAGDAPATIEVRETTDTITVSIQDLVASVTKSGVALDPSAPILVSTGGGKLVALSQRRASVTLPVVGTRDRKITVVATDANGERVTDTITVKKSAKPLALLAGEQDDTGGFPLLPVVLVLVVLLAGGAFVALRRRTNGTVAP